MITKVQREEIDNMTYEQLLQKWRFAPAGDRFFAGEVGIYFKEVFFKRRKTMDNKDLVKASKSIGWERQ